MSLPVHISAARHALDELMEDPDGPAVLHAAVRGFREDRWTREYVDSIGQDARSPSPARWPMEQVFMFVKLHTMIHTGLIAVVPVLTGGPPLPDRERAGNAERLARLPHPFTAQVDPHQSNAAGDGLLEWRCPIEVSVATGFTEESADGKCRPIPMHFMVPPGSATLEIGTSLPSRTWQHLVLDSGVVARWPYGHSQLRLFVNFDFIDAKDRMMEWFGIPDLIRKRGDSAA